MCWPRLPCAGVCMVQLGHETRVPCLHWLLVCVPNPWFSSVHWYGRAVVKFWGLNLELGFLLVVLSLFGSIDCLAVSFEEWFFMWEVVFVMSTASGNIPRLYPLGQDERAFGLWESFRFCLLSACLTWWLSHWKDEHWKELVEKRPV